MGVPVVDDLYRTYEWLVPGIGSVVAILSVEGEANWLFNTASGFFRMTDTNLGGDLLPPSIVGVTDLPDTPNPGPYNVVPQLRMPAEFRQHCFIIQQTAARMRVSLRRM